MQKVKNGLYYKKIKDGKISVGGKKYHIPVHYQYVFVDVSGDEVYLCNIHGNRVVKLTEVNENTLKAAL